MAESSGNSESVVELSIKTHGDLETTYNATASMWDESQAEFYISYLHQIFSYIAEDPDLGDQVEGFSDYFVFTAKYRKRRSAHGHRIFYRKITNGIRIIRVLHTAMYWPSHLKEEKS